MGGPGSGGRRVGSGKKLKSDLEHAISGTASHGVLLAHPSSTAIAPAETFDPPLTLLGKAARAVWDELAPCAFHERTLTRSTEAQFVILCRNVVLERKMARSKRGAGNSNHRGMIQRVDAELTKFCLSPFGKAVYAAQPAVAVNPLDKYTKKVGA